MKRTNQKGGPSSDVSLEQRSLSERVVLLEQELDFTWTNTTVPQLYDRLYSSVYGTQHRSRSVEDDALISRAYALCLKHGAAIDMFILANMIELREWLATQRRLTFNPSMLTTYKAVARYNRFLTRMKWRFNNTGSGAIGSLQWIGSVRDDLFEDEERIAEFFIRTNLNDDPMTWDEACEAAKPGRMWREFRKGHGMNVQTVRTMFGMTRPKKEMQLATLKAAWTVTEKLQHRLPDRIGFTEFGWSDLLELVKTVLPSRRRKPRLTRKNRSAIEDTGAVMWEPGASVA